MSGLVERLPRLLREIGFAGTSWSIPLSVFTAAGTGTQRQAGRGAPLSLAIVDKPASGRAAMQGNGSTLLLASLRAGKTTGKASVFHFRGPTQKTYDYMAAPLSRRLVCSTEIGLTTWRTNGQWQSTFRPSSEELAGADVVLSGGYVHPLSGELRDDLIAAGLGDFITLEEVRQ